jgi:hypothetical protein
MLRKRCHFPSDDLDLDCDAVSEAQPPLKKLRSSSPAQLQSRVEGVVSKAEAVQLETSLPLTLENLVRLDSINTAMPNTQSSRSGSLSPSRRSRNIGEESNRLQQYNIHLPSPSTALPPELQLLVDDILTTPRLVQSPNARKIVGRQALAEQMHERDSRNLLRSLLLFRSAWEDDGGEPLINVTYDSNLDRTFMPPQKVGSPFNLEMPQPDDMVGYIKSATADTVTGIEAPFSVQEEMAFKSFGVSQETHFPFLTCQWKSQRGTGTHLDAQIQAARDGATIVRSLNEFYLATADPLAASTQAPSVADSCHFSATCDINSVRLFVHWYSPTDESYRMRKIKEGFLSDEDSMLSVRRAFRNILDHARGPRLKIIKTSVAVLVQRDQVQVRRQPSPRAAGAGSVVARLDNTAPSSASLHSDLGSIPDLPPTPFSATSVSDGIGQPEKKRQRVSTLEEEAL